MVELGQRNSWFMRHKLDGQNRIARLFFAKTSSQKVLRLNYEVLLMDCTYKTNLYRMPLCIISGVTPLNTTYYIAFCFLSSETTEDYTWLLRMLKELYEMLDIPDPIVIITDAEVGLIRAIPLVFTDKTHHLLCIWHMNKNVLVHCRKWFHSQEEWKAFYAMWQTVLYADTERKFEEAWSQMQLKYQDSAFLPMEYLEYEVLCPYKTKIIWCFTNQVRHFGNTVTSRSESQNARLKAELCTSVG